MGADGTDPGGKPAELIEAELVVGLYERFGYHPRLLDEDAGLLKMLKIVAMAEGGEDG